MSSSWHYVRAGPGMLAPEEQWIYRWRGRVPAISLRRQESTGSSGKRCAESERQSWRAALLLRSGLSTQSLLMPHSSLQEAQAEAQVALHRMGWEAGDG